jgi:TolB protein
MRALALALAVALAACVEDHRAPDVPDPCAIDTPGAAWLAFASRRTDDYEIWRARADGSCTAQVTHAMGPDLFPTWSGSTVVFASERDGVQRLWSHDLATGDEAQLDSGALAATAPAFSPGGTRLAFEGRTDGATLADVYVMPAAGGPAETLEDVPGGGAGPAWAPDGETVYFVSQRSGSYDVWAVPAGGGAALRVTTRSRIVGKPAVTADGGSILYARTMAGASTTEVVRQDLSTGAVSVVSSLDDSEPAVSTDGERVALRSFRAGHADVVIEALDGSGATFLTSDAPSDGTPTFAPLP